MRSDHDRPLVPGDGIGRVIVVFPFHSYVSNSEGLFKNILRDFLIKVKKSSVTKLLKCILNINLKINLKTIVLVSVL